MNKLVISELFYSVQGEGQTMGVPSIFLRLAGCNILCKSESWICDTIEVWQKGVKTNFEDVFSSEYVEKLKDGVHLVITGGEPLLHQKKLIEFLKWFDKEHGFLPIIEIETNGTIIPEDYIFNVTEYFNVSPKLSNSGETKKRRFNELSLDKLNKHTGSIFKFVISDKNDFLDVLTEYSNHIDMKKVVLMPAGESQEKLKETRETVAQLCIDMNLRYSDRLHVVIWNKKTGV